MHQASPFGKIRVVVIICCLILILGIFAYAYLIDKNDVILPKDEISDNVGSIEDSNYDFVSSYIKKYGVGNINAYKINQAQTLLDSNYYKDLPPLKLWAEEAVKLFVADYYDNVNLDDKEAVTDAILTCLIRTIGDNWAYYRTASEFEDYSNSLEGGEEFVGIGIQINSTTREITMVYRDSGAEAAGIKPRDVLWAVEDKNADEVTTDELLALIKGEPGTTVKIAVKRQDVILEFNVERRILTERSVYYEMDEDKVGYIVISQFLYDTVDQFKEAIDFCVANGAKALVIDVRYNPGGLLSSVVDIIDYITPDKEGRRIGSYTQSGREVVYYTDDGHGIDLPIAVICNEYTASAGELFTAAMRDYGNEGVLDTVIVGTGTYGKGVAQNSYQFSDKSAITFTIGYFNPPCNVNFDGVGVTLDEEHTVPEIDTEDAPFNKAKEMVLELVELTKDQNTEITPGMAA